MYIKDSELDSLIANTESDTGHWGVKDTWLPLVKRLREERDFYKAKCETQSKSWMSVILEAFK